MANKFLVGYAVKSGIVACMLYLGSRLTWQLLAAQGLLLLMLAFILSEEDDDDDTA